MCSINFMPIVCSGRVGWFMCCARTTGCVVEGHDHVDFVLMVWKWLWKENANWMISLVTASATSSLFEYRNQSHFVLTQMVFSFCLFLKLLSNLIVLLYFVYSQLPFSIKWKYFEIFFVKFTLFQYFST